jgi:hypothetical protein
MKHKFVGLFFILIAASAPYTLRAIFPTFLYGTAIATVCFWIGFLFVLTPIGKGHHLNPYLKWANYAVWIHIFLSILLSLYFYIVFLHYEIREGLGMDLFILIEHITNPIKHIFSGLVPPHTVEQSDGSVLVYQSFVRSILSTFINLVLFSSLGAIPKIVKDNIRFHSDAAPQRR